MTIAWQEELRPGVALTSIVRQATAALVAMDADRLEELARCCADLNRVWDEGGDRAAASMEMRAAAGDLALFEAILHETRANLTVLTRLHAIRLRDALAWSGGKRGIRPDGEREALGFWPCRERMPDYGDN